MSEGQYKFLQWLTYGTYNELFEIIDDDGIRKPAIRTKIRNVWASPKGDKNFNVEEYILTIDWRLLDKYRERVREAEQYNVGEISEEEKAKQLKRYGEEEDE